MDCSPLGSSIHGILQARLLEWVAISFSRGSSQPRDRTQVSCIVGINAAICALHTLLCFHCSPGPFPVQELPQVQASLPLLDDSPALLSQHLPHRVAAKTASHQNTAYWRSHISTVYDTTSTLLPVQSHCSLGHLPEIKKTCIYFPLIIFSLAPQLC